MTIRFIAALFIVIATSCLDASPAKELPQVKFQFGFFHFHNDQVRVTVNGKTVLNRMMTVSRDNERYGLAAFFYINLPSCADIVVSTKRQRVAQHFCRTDKTKSIIVDGGPPLTMTVKDQVQGLD